MLALAGLQQVMDAKEKPVIVLAGNYREFADYAKGNKRFVFGDRQDNMRGLDVDKIIEIGTFWDRRDAYSMWQVANAQIRGHK